jgi:hypothetical protein
MEVQSEPYKFQPQAQISTSKAELRLHPLNFGSNAYISLPYRHI